MTSTASQLGDGAWDTVKRAIYPYYKR